MWTDGACSGNPGPGGWAWATKDGRQASGGSPLTTNQRMEIQAALEAVRALAGPLVVVSDSTYVVNCFRDGWWQGWLARGWMTSAKKPVANRDLWEPLVTAVRERGDVSFRWVKGHSGDPMNDLVDSAGRRGRAASAVTSRGLGSSPRRPFQARLTRWAATSAFFGRSRCRATTDRSRPPCRPASGAYIGAAWRPSPRS